MITSQLSQNALLKRFGRTLDDVRTELKAIPFDAEAEAEEVQENEHFRRVVRRCDFDDNDEPTDRNERDRRIYAARGRPRTAQPQPLERLLAPLRCVVILGDPGGGKTEHLKHIVRTVARTTTEEPAGVFGSLWDRLGCTSCQRTARSGGNSAGAEPA